MRPVIIFFLYLCMQLLGGHNYAHASVHHCSIGYSSAMRIEKTQGTEKGFTKNAVHITESNGQVEDDNSIISDEDDGDEELMLKHALGARYLVAFFYAFISDQRFSSRTERLPFCNHLSHLGSSKYIVQRVLRI